MDDREKLFDLMIDSNNPAWGNFTSNMEMLKFVDYLIANGVTVQRHGRWERRKTGHMIPFSDTVCTLEYKEFCTVCNLPNKHYKPPYCPHCGAKMDLPESPKKEKQ